MKVNGRDYEYDRIVASTGNDRTVKLWNLHEGWQINDFKGHYSGLRTFRGCPGRPDLFIAALYDNKISVWKDDGKRPQCLCALSAHNAWVWAADIRYDGSCLYAVSGSQDQLIRMWNLNEAREIRLNGIEQHNGKVESVLFSKDGRRFLSAGDDRRVLLHTIECMEGNTWNVSSAVISDLQNEGHEKNVKYAIFSEDGSVFSGSEDGAIQERPMRYDPHPAYTYRFSSGWARNICLNRAETWLLAGGGQFNNKCCAALWGRGRVDRPLAYFLGHAENVTYAVFAPDEKYVLTVSDDYSLKVYDISGLSATTAADAEPALFDALFTLRHGSKLFYIEFSQDGTFFYVTSLDGTLYRWNWNALMRAHCDMDAATASQESVLLTTAQNVSGFLFHGCNFSNLAEAESQISDEKLGAAFATYGCARR